MLASPDGLDSRVLATYPGLESALGLAWAPTSDRIVLARPLPEPSENDAGVSPEELARSVDLVLVSPSDGSQVRLTQDATPERDPSWSSSGDAILFTAQGAGDRLELAIVATDGSEHRALAPQLAASRFGRWSPDGSRIAFQGSLHPEVLALYTVNADGTGLAELTAADDLSSPAWSPDGNEIAFGAGGVYVISASGGAARPLIELPGVEVSDLAWARDGSVLALAAAAPGNESGAG